MAQFTRLNMLACRLCVVSLMEMLERHWRYTCVGIQVRRNQTNMFAALHYRHATSKYLLWQTICRVKRGHEKPSAGTLRLHMTWALLRMQFGTHCMRSNCVCFLYNLQKSYSQGTVIFTSNSLDCLYRNCNWTWLWGLCTVDWCGNIHKKWNKESPQHTWTGNWDFSCYYLPISAKIQHLGLGWNL